MTLLITPERTAPILFDFVKSEVSVGVGGTDPIDVEVGTSGPAGPKGPEGGTPVVALPYNSWPPVNPQPNTLYLRLAP